MFVSAFLCQAGPAAAALVLMLALGGCAQSVPNASHAIGEQPSVAGDPATQTLQAQLAALGPTVRPDEAERAAVCSLSSSLDLATEYRVVRPPLFHNLLVNLGLKRRGLCYHWAEDLSARLQSLELSTLQVRWAMARAGTVREHNAVVLSAQDQPFAQGILLDAWRHSGRLYWSRVDADRYPWVEGELPRLSPQSD